MPIEKIEDLSDAVLGAGLGAVQLSRGKLEGSLLFSQFDDIIFGSGLINGKVALSGPLSKEQLTIGFGLRISPGSRHWLEEVRTGSMGIFHPGDEHEAIYQAGSLYVTASLSLDRLEETASFADLVLDRQQLGGTGFHHREIEESRFARLREMLFAAHVLESQRCLPAPQISAQLLRIMILHIARTPRRVMAPRHSVPYSRIAARAQDYILAHLEHAIGIDDMAQAAHTSRSTLCRAFQQVLAQSPQQYVRTLRLNRIREQLARADCRQYTITDIASRWGINELGRFAGWYRELFGELPSQTVKQSRRWRRNQLMLTRIA